MTESMRGLIAFMFLLKCSFALHIIQTEYWFSGEDPAKAKEACTNDPTSFSFTLRSPSGFITDVYDTQVYNGSLGPWSGTDSCYFWSIDDNGKILFQNFTYPMQDANDIRDWATRPFCFSAPHDTKRMESGDCLIIENPDPQVESDCYTKVNIGRKSKSCVLVEEKYKNKFCTQPEKAFPLYYELEINECDVNAYVPDDEYHDGISAFFFSKVKEDLYQIQTYKDPSCLFEDIDPEDPPQYVKIGECQPDFDDDSETPFKTWTKVVSLTCDNDKKLQNSEHRKSSNYTSFTRLMKKGVRNTKLQTIKP